MVSRTRAIRWEIDRVDLAELYPDFRSMAVPADGAFRTCLHADLSARLALMEGKIEEALVQAEFLQTKQYGNPEYLRFCRKFELCQP